MTELCKSVSQLMVEWPQLTQSRPFTQMQPGSRSANTTNHDIKATMDLRKSTKAALQRCTSRHKTTSTFSLYLELLRLQTWFGLSRLNGRLAMLPRFEKTRTPSESSIRTFKSSLASPYKTRNVLNLCCCFFNS